MKYVIVPSRPEVQHPIRLLHPVTMEMATTEVQLYPQKNMPYSTVDMDGRSFTELNDGPWWVEGEERHARTVAAALAHKHPGWVFVISEVKIEYVCQAKAPASAKHSALGVIPE